MEVRGYMDRGEAIFFGSGFRWDRTSMEVRCTSWNLDRFEMVSLWIWNTIAGTWLGVRRHLDGGEMQISRPGLRWVATWMDARDLPYARDDFIPPPSRWQIASIKVPIIASQLYSVPISMPPRYYLPPCPISPASRFLSQFYPCIYHLTSIKVPKLSSLLHPCRVSFHPSADICFSPPSRLGITYIQLWQCTRSHPGSISTPARSSCEYQHHPCPLPISI